MKVLIYIPTREEEHTLLDDGPFGERAAMVFSGQVCGHRDHNEWTDESDYHYSCYMCGDYPSRALVLEVDGVEVKSSAARMHNIPEREGKTERVTIR